MRELTILVPTRGRPGGLARLIEACHSTCALEDVQLLVGVCDDDPMVDDTGGYRWVVNQMGGYAKIDVRLMVMPAPAAHRGFVYPLNLMAAVTAPESFALAVLGDDHVPRAEAWDWRLWGELRERPVSFAYGNDLVHGASIPTSCMMTSTVFGTLGYIAPPELGHLYVDNVWKLWGKSTHLTYRHDVVIEHLHPLVGKGEWDDIYRQQDPNGDQAIFFKYEATRLMDDVAALRRELERSVT